MYILSNVVYSIEYGIIKNKITLRENTKMKVIYRNRLVLTDIYFIHSFLLDKKRSERKYKRYFEIYLKLEMSRILA